VRRAGDRSQRWLGCLKLATQTWSKIPQAGVAGELCETPPTAIHCLQKHSLSLCLVLISKHSRSNFILYLLPAILHVSCNLTSCWQPQGGGKSACGVDVFLLSTVDISFWYCIFLAWGRGGVDSINKRIETGNRNLTEEEEKENLLQQTWCQSLLQGGQLAAAPARKSQATRLPYTPA
jgi:hypothetical protein